MVRGCVVLCVFGIIVLTDISHANGFNEDLYDRFVWEMADNRPGWDIWAAKGKELVLPCDIGTQDYIIHGVEENRMGHGVIDPGNGTPFQREIGSYYLSDSGNKESSGSNTTWVNINWQKDNQTLIMDKRISITRDGDLNISKVVYRRDGDSDEGFYHCLVRLPHGVVVSPTIQLLKARMNKTVTISSSHGSVVEGRSVRFNCNVISSPAANITWLHNNTIIDITGKTVVPQLNVLLINHIQLSDAGSYQCSATNSLLKMQSQQSEIFSLVVVPGCINEAHVPPYFLQDSLPPDKIEFQVIEGQQVVLECLASGWPLPQVIWFNSKNWQEWEESTSTDRIKITNGTLVIKYVHESDSGTYRCTANNINPYTQRDYLIKQDTVLDVLIPPRITGPPEKVSKILAKTARLNCTVSGHPHSKITWYRKGSPVNLTGDFHQRHDGQLVNTFPMPSDSGLYQCIAFNRAGYDSRWAILDVISPGNLPDPPTDLQYSGITPYSVVVTWSPVPQKPGRPPVRGYSIIYNILGSYGLAKYSLSVTPSINLRNLHPNTDYVVKIHSFSSHPSEESQSLIFKTPEEVPSTASTIDLKATSNSSIMVQWTDLSKDKANGEIVGYQIYWRKRRQLQPHNNNVPASEHYFEISGLKPGKKYNVLVLPGTSAGYPNPREFEESWITFHLPKQINVTSTDEFDITTTVSISLKTNRIEEETNHRMRYETSICYDSISESELNDAGDTDISISPTISIHFPTGSEGSIGQIIANFYNAKEELNIVQTKVTLLQAQLDILRDEQTDSEVEHSRAQEKLNDAKEALKSASRRLNETITKFSNAETLLYIAKTELHTAEMKLNIAEAEFTEAVEDELSR